MRCLWITRQDPRPADSGELIYSRGLLESTVADGGIEITVLAHTGPTPARSAQAAPPGLTYVLPGPIPSGRLKSLASSLPSDAFRLGNPVMREALARLLAQGRWDRALIDQAACGWAVPPLRHAGLRFAYIAHNHEASVRRSIAASPDTPTWTRPIFTWDAWKYGRMEARLVREAFLLTAITPADRDQFLAQRPDLPALVLTPGYHPRPSTEPALPMADRPREVVLAGAFEWVAKRRNLEAFLDAASLVFPAARIAFTVAGKAEPDYFRALREKHPWCGFHANVPSMAPFLARARMGLIPEALGGGFKLKALDYIFGGLPLATLRPALSGVPVDPATDAVVADDAASLVRAIADRLDDTAFLESAARSALAKCRQAFSWSDRGRLLAQALREPPRDTTK